MGGIRELILYQKFDDGNTFYGLAGLMECCGNASGDMGGLRETYYKCLHDLLEFSANHGFEGNIWHSFLAFLLADHENAYSRACENLGDKGGALSMAALHDFEILQEIFRFDFCKLKQWLGVSGIELITEYRGTGESRKLSRRVRDRIGELCMHLEQAEDAKAFQRAVTDFYKDFGVGKIGLHKAFRIEDGARIVPVANIADVSLDDLEGYEIAKQKLIANTEAFVSGRRANNCLLYGDAGTGKSSSVKAIANQYYDRGLRIIEVYKHQFRDLHDVIAQIKNRNYKFILYMDDLSFEDFEIEYKYLKAVIEGGLEEKPDNILIYATSNRRHLIREKFSDKRELSDDLHNNDTVQEKLSLAARFGMQIYFGAPDKREFGQIVLALARRNKIPMTETELLAEANKWELSRGGRSGRAAQQLIDNLLAEEGV